MFVSHSLLWYGAFQEATRPCCVSKDWSMSKNDRFVVKPGDEWAVKKGGAERASAVFGTQREAERYAKEVVSNLGGGEVRIQGENGRWRDSDTVPPGNDPHPPIDKE